MRPVQLRLGRWSACAWIILAWCTSLSAQPTRRVGPPSVLRQSTKTARAAQPAPSTNTPQRSEYPPPAASDALGDETEEIEPLYGDELMSEGEPLFDGAYGHGYENSLAPLAHTLPGCDQFACALPAGLWVDLEYLLWWRRGRELPPLVTTAPNGGVLPEASVLFGGGAEGTQARPGGRLRVGGWLDSAGILAVEGSFLALGNGAATFRADSTEFSTLARPFFNFTAAQGGGFVGQDALQVALPGASTGSIAVNSSSDVVMGDVMLHGLLYENHCMRLDLIGGYQVARIDEDLQISSATTLVANNNLIAVEDSFFTDNEFQGGAIGFELVRTYDRLNVELLAKIGFGNMRQSVTIDGRRQVTVPGDETVISTGGLLAQSTNIGTFHRDEFAVNPALGISLNYEVMRCLNLTAGYSVVYWNKVAQPGDQIDPLLGVNPTQPPPTGQPRRPQFTFEDGQYYLHGINLGVQLVY